MNDPIKLLFDECLGQPLLEDIKKLLRWDIPEPKIDHIFSYFKSGIHDDVWIPKISNENWIIVTSDRGKKNDGRKLPKICSEYKITHILLGPSVLHLKQSQKAQIIVAAWEMIKECKNAKKGSRFMLSKRAGNPSMKQVT